MLSVICNAVGAARAWFSGLSSAGFENGPVSAGYVGTIPSRSSTKFVKAKPSTVNV